MVTNHWLVSSLVTRLVFLQCTIQSSVGVSALWDLYTAVYTTWGGCGAQPRLEKMNRFSPRLNFTTSTKRKAPKALPRPGKPRGARRVSKDLRRPDVRVLITSRA